MGDIVYFCQDYVDCEFGDVVSVMFWGVYYFNVLGVCYLKIYVFYVIVEYVYIFQFWQFIEYCSIDWGKLSDQDVNIICFLKQCFW